MWRRAVGRRLFQSSCSGSDDAMSDFTPEKASHSVASCSGTSLLFPCVAALAKWTQRWSFLELTLVIENVTARNFCVVLEQQRCPTRQIKWPGTCGSALTHITAHGDLVWPVLLMLSSFTASDRPFAVTQGRVAPHPMAAILSASRPLTCYLLKSAHLYSCVWPEGLSFLGCPSRRLVCPCAFLWKPYFRNGILVENINLKSKTN